MVTLQPEALALGFAALRVASSRRSSERDGKKGLVVRTCNVSAAVDRNRVFPHALSGEYYGYVTKTE